MHSSFVVVKFLFIKDGKRSNTAVLQGFPAKRKRNFTRQNRFVPIRYNTLLKFILDFLIGLIYNFKNFSICNRPIYKNAVLKYYFFAKLCQSGTQTAQITAPIIDRTVHMPAVASQPLFSAMAEKPHVDIPLPM